MSGKRTHKFLVHVMASYSIIDDMETSGVDVAILNKVDYCEEDYVRVVECAHEKPEDNEVEVVFDVEVHVLGGATLKERQEYFLLRDVNGDLFYANAVYTREMLANMME